MRRLLIISLVVIVAIGGVFLAGWGVAGITTNQARAQQIVQSVERMEQIVLLGLNIQGLETENTDAQIADWVVPGTEKTVFMQYSFTAKLGIDGEDVDIVPVGDNQYRVTIPEFIFIGYDNLALKAAVQSNNVLSWIAPKIDEEKMRDTVLSKKSQETYVASNEDLLKDQAESFYTKIITSIDPSAGVRFEYR